MLGHKQNIVSKVLSTISPDHCCSDNSAINSVGYTIFTTEMKGLLVQMFCLGFLTRAWLALKS